MTTTAVQRDPWLQIMMISFPELDDWVVPLDPPPVVGVYEDRRARPNAWLHSTMLPNRWVCDKARAETPPRASIALIVASSIRLTQSQSTLPLGPLYKQCTLPDGKLWLSPNPEQAWFRSDLMTLRCSRWQHLNCDPGLTFRVDILPLILADQTIRRGLFGRRVLVSTLHTYVVRHLAFPRATFSSLTNGIGCTLCWAAVFWCLWFPISGQF